MLFLSGMASLSYGVLVGLVRRVFQVGPKAEADYDTPQSSEPPPPPGAALGVPMESITMERFRRGKRPAKCNYCR